jgi:hypothetical protein
VVPAARRDPPEQEAAVPSANVSTTTSATAWQIDLSENGLTDLRNMLMTLQGAGYRVQVSSTYAPLPNTTAPFCVYLLRGVGDVQRGQQGQYVVLDDAGTATVMDAGTYLSEYAPADPPDPPQPAAPVQPIQPGSSLPPADLTRINQAVSDLRGLVSS